MIDIQIVTKTDWQSVGKAKVFGNKARLFPPSYLNKILVLLIRASAKGGFFFQLLCWVIEEYTSHKKIKAFTNGRSKNNSDITGEWCNENDGPHPGDSTIDAQRLGWPYQLLVSSSKFSLHSLRNQKAEVLRWSVKKVSPNVKVVISQPIHVKTFTLDVKMEIFN